VTGLATGEEKQLTQNSEGFLKYYVYFFGNPYQGLEKLVFVFTPKAARLFIFKADRYTKLAWMVK
jgi:hypothetical protein